MTRWYVNTLALVSLWGRTGDCLAPGGGPARHRASKVVAEGAADVAAAEERGAAALADGWEAACDTCKAARPATADPPSLVRQRADVTAQVGKQPG